MTKAKRYVVGFAVLAGLFLIGSLMRSPESQLKGTYSSPVTVFNTSSAPAITSLIDTPGRIPYQGTLTQIAPSPQVSQLTFTFPLVPPNHRLVVQHISGFFVITGPAPPAALVSITFNVFAPALSAFFTPSLGSNPTFDFNAFDQPVQVYFDAGQQPLVGISGPTFQAGQSEGVTLTGYMLDCSAAPCAAMTP